MTNFQSNFNIQFSKEIKELPKKPGVYLFKNKQSQIIYVGKAVNLRNRVKSYYMGKNGEKRTNDLLKYVEKVDFVVVNSEIEALLLEARLIKQYQPKYNIRLKDDTRFLYIGITKDEYPRVHLIRQPENETNIANWFGPFPSSYSIREILRLLRRIFPYCTDPKCKPVKPCFYFHLHLCPGIGIVSKREYRQNIQKIKLFLNGEILSLVKGLTKQMRQASKKLCFEDAQKIKKQIEMISSLLGRYQRSDEEERSKEQLEQLREIIVKYQGFDPFLIQKVEAYDISNLGKNIIVGSMAVFQNGEPDNSQYRQFKIENFKSDIEGIKEILRRRLNHQEWIFPQLILVDGGKGQISSALMALREKKLAERIALVGLAKEIETIIIPKIKKGEIISWKRLNYSSSSALLHLLQNLRDEAHRFAQRYYKKLHKKKLLALSMSKD